MEAKRLDLYLSEVENISRNKANELIKAKKIKIDGKVVSKPSLLIKEETLLEVNTEHIYVSRSALKLKNYLLKYPQDIKDKICLDIGSSTGGFSEVLLEFEPKSLSCVDVGSNQLSNVIKENPVVNAYEKCDIRDFSEYVKYDLIVSDVSFISLLKIINKIDRLSKGKIILLFKPQFEVGVGVKRDKKGVVLDLVAIEKAMVVFEEETKKLNWKLINKEESSILGKEGTVEFIYEFFK